MSRTEVAILGFLNIVNEMAHPGHNPLYLFYTSRLDMGCPQISVYFRGFKISCPVSSCYCRSSHISYRFIVTSVGQQYSTLRCLKLHYAPLSGELMPTPARGWDVPHLNGVHSFPSTGFEGSLWTTVQA